MINWSDISYEILLSVLDHCERNEKVQFARLYGLGVLHRVIETMRSMDEEWCFSSVLVSTIANDLDIYCGPRSFQHETVKRCVLIRKEILTRQLGLMSTWTGGGSEVAT